jgi:hypothetical protein
MTHRSKTLRRLHHSSLFWRFILIGIAVLMPLTGALVQLAGEERERAVEATRKRAELLITYAVDSQNHVLEEAKAVLRFLADAPEVRSGGADCSLFLRRHVALHRWINGLRLSDTHGGEICSERTGAAGPNLGEREFFRKALQGSGFTFSELAVDPRSGSLGITAAVSVLQDGQVVGVVSADISPGVFEERSPIHVDPELDIAMFVVNRKGALIAYYPPSANRRESTCGSCP